MEPMFLLDGDNLTIKNKHIEKNFSGIASAEGKDVTPKTRAVPYYEITAIRTDGSNVCYSLWDDIAAIRISDDSENPLLTLTGHHWTVRSICFNAVTDTIDTLVCENEYNLFEMGLGLDIKGDVFFFEDNESGAAHVIISETPEWTRGTLFIPKRPGGQVSIKNNGYSVTVCDCKKGECEATLRSYFRHVNRCPGLVSMSNTWGDYHGASRVCESFVTNEIESAREIGVDIVQIDDGWQLGDTAKMQRDEKGRRYFRDPCWELNKERFPNGIMPLANKAAEYGIKLGMWFAPHSRDGFADFERDKSVLERCYKEYGARFFKLDMYQVESVADSDKMKELLNFVYSFGEGISVQMDITSVFRLNYLCGMDYGTIFVENRYTRSANYFPHRVLRNLWSLAKYIPTDRFQFELANPDLNTECYREGDPFAPVGYDMDYIFATVMLSNPLFWMEMQFLSDKRRAELAKIMTVWKEHRAALSAADVTPIGDKPSGRSFSGFYVVKGEDKYLLLFRELTEESSYIFKAPVTAAECEILASNCGAKVSVGNGYVEAEFGKQRGYAFVKLK